MTPRSSLSSHPSSAPAGGNVITVASGKGGVGKTWFAVTLAHAMARAGNRVLLLDGDLGLANVDIQLGLSVEYDLSAVFSGRADLANSVTAFEDGGFDIVAGASGTGSLAALAPDEIISVRERMLALAARYDRAIIDLGAGIDKPVRILTATPGTCLVVTTDEPTALTDAYAFVKVISASRPGADIRVVVNMAESRQHGERTYATLDKACKNFLRLSPPLAGIIRRDPHVRESIRYQCPLLTRYPNSDAASDVDAIATVLSG